jgi:hypothetical protein
MNAAGRGSSETSDFVWTHSNALRRTSEILRSEGPLVLWFRMLGEIAYRRMILFERLLDAPPPPVRPDVPLAISELQPAAIGDYLALRPGADPAEIRSRLEQGQHCWIARHQGTLIHAIWTATGRVRIHYLDCEIQFAPGEAYIYESFTAPGFRRLNISLARSEVMVRHLMERSFTRLLALVMPENPAGINVTLRAGYQRAGQIGRLKLGPWRRDFCRLAPGVAPLICKPCDSPGSRAF